MKICKSEMKFLFFSMENILTGSQVPENSPKVLPTYVRILYNHKNKNSIFCDSCCLFNPVKCYWSVKSDVYIMQQIP